MAPAKASIESKPQTHQVTEWKLHPVLIKRLVPLPNWVVWRWEINKSRTAWTKPPYQARNPDAFAKTNDRSTWGIFDDAIAAVAAGKADGIGFALFETNICALDLDNCRDPISGRIDPIARAILARCGATYFEETVSGTGLRVIGTGAGEPIHRKQKIPGSSVEVESYRASERYITISGMVLDGVKPRLPDLLNIDAAIEQIVDDLDHEGTPQSGAKAGNTTKRKEERKKDFASLPAALRSAIRESVAPGKRSGVFHHAVKWLKELDWSIDDIVELLARYPDGPGLSKYGLRLATEVARSYNAPDKHSEFARASQTVDDSTNDEPVEGEEREANVPPPPRARPVINVTARISIMADQAEAALRAIKLPIYQRGGELVRPIIRTVAASHGRKTRSAQLKTLSQTYLRDTLCKHADWQKFDERKHKWCPAQSPEVVADILLNRDGHWKFPDLVGVIAVPTIRPDGSLLSKQGYDPVTQLLLIEPPPMPEIPDKPTKDHAAAALKLLLELVKETPFANEIAKAVAISGFITPCVRAACQVVPLHASSAPVAGSGKSFLWDIAASIASGQRRMPVVSATDDEKELEKRLVGIMLEGQPLVSIDNCNGVLGGSFLCQVTERYHLELRPLGTSKMIHIDNGGTSFFASGNNIQIAGDLGRRTLLTRLNPNLEEPHLRKFNSDPISTVLKDRGKYIAAALTIVRAYHVAGKPDASSRQLATYQEWSDFVRSALMWLGLDDPVKSIQLAAADDPQREALSDVIATWRIAIGTGMANAMTMAQVATKAGEMERKQHGYHDETIELKYPEFNTALRSAQALIHQGNNKVVDPLALGQWARRVKERIVDGHCLRNQVNRKGISVWWIGKVGDDQ